MKARLSVEQSHHLINVLRMAKDSEIIVIDNTNTEYKARILDDAAKEMEIIIVEQVLIEREPQTKVTIFQGLPKADKMEQVIMRGTEIGAHGFVPVTMARSVVQLDSKKAAKKLERWQKIALSAAQQAARQHIPDVQALHSFKDMLSVLNTYDKVFLLYENEQEQSFNDISLNMFMGKIALIIGPEGGLADHEVGALLKAGAYPISLGPRIMRTETAGIVALSIILYSAGDMRRKH